VSQLVLSDNGLDGHLPPGLGKPTHLAVLNLNGKRPATYLGCTSIDLHNSSVSDDLYTLGLARVLVHLCNFCAPHDEVPDVFHRYPNLQHSFWGGNALAVPLPASIGTLRNLTGVSFDINAMSGAIPLSWCALAALPSRWTAASAPT